MDERVALWPAARDLRPEHVRNCRLVANRKEMVSLLPRNAVCAEVGIWLCQFSAEILDAQWLNVGRSKFPAEIENGHVAQTKVKAERFIQTAFREWAYAHAYPSADQRAADLPPWLRRYNWHRPHGGVTFDSRKSGNALGAR